VASRDAEEEEGREEALTTSAGVYAARVAEIEFSDGKRLIDDPLVGPIKQATDGAPESFTFKDAMKRLNKVNERNFLREARGKIVREHLDTWGL